MEEKEVTFFEALKSVMYGRRITSRSWGNPDIFGRMVDGRLKIYWPEDGDWKDWIVSDGDLVAEDWIILED